MMNQKMHIIIDDVVKNRIDNYVRYLIDLNHTDRERAVEKFNHLFDTIKHMLSNSNITYQVSPYWNFGGCGRGYRMIKIKDKWTKTTVWCIAYEDVDNETRVVRGIELESVLASTDKIVYPPYQMRLPIDEQRLRQIIRQVIREHLCA